MAETTLFLKVIEETISWLKRRQGRKGAEGAKANTVLEALRAAVTQTRAYIGDVANNPDARDRDREISLSTVWNEVGMALRRMGGPEQEDLYDRCFVKADYWSDHRSWDDNRDRDIDIGLEAVEEAIRDTLRSRDGNA